MKVVICALLTAILTCFCFCAVWLNAHTEPESLPQIVILGTVQQLTFHEQTVWYIDYLIDGHPQGVTLYNEGDIAPFIDALSQSGDVRHLKE